MPLQIGQLADGPGPSGYSTLQGKGNLRPSPSISTLPCVARRDTYPYPGDGPSALRTPPSRLGEC